MFLPEFLFHLLLAFIKLNIFCICCLLPEDKYPLHKPNNITTAADRTNLKLYMIVINVPGLNAQQPFLVILKLLHSTSMLFCDTRFTLPGVVHVRPSFPLYKILHFCCITVRIHRCIILRRSQSIYCSVITSIYNYVLKIVCTNCMISSLHTDLQSFQVDQQVPKLKENSDYKAFCLH